MSQLNKSFHEYASVMTKTSKVSPRQSKANSLQSAKRAMFYDLGDPK